MLQAENPLERRKKIEFPFHYAQDKKLVNVVAKIEDEPGALAAVLNVLRPQVNLVGTTSYSVPGHTAIFSGFGEMISKHETAQSIQGAVGRCPGVKACQVWESRAGLLVDWYHTGIESGMGEPYILMPTKALSSTFDEIAHTFGSGAEVILYLEGRKFAEARFAVYKELFDGNMANRLNELSHIFEALGYGSSLITLDETFNSVTISTYDCFECSGGTKNSRNCAFTRGVAVGIFEPLLKVELGCEEIQCRLRGNRHCEFVLKPKQNPS
jgi:predicted hydrocarbon binding protein